MVAASQLPSAEIGSGDCSSDGTSRSDSDSQDDGEVLDISGNTWQLSNFDGAPRECTDTGLFVYKNTFHLLPSSIGKHRKLKTLKFFANEVEVLPPEAGELVELERVQIRVSSPRISEAPFRNLKSLKELELCKVPPRPSTLSILSEITNLKCLTKLTISHFSIRYFPPEIGSLNKLEELDLSFNKLKSLPNSIADLSSLRILKITNNKIDDIPAELSSLKSLQNLDLSSNRLTSISSLKLRSMLALQYLNLQFNRISYSCHVPPWICCDMRGNNEGTRKDEKCTSLDISAQIDGRGHINIQTTQRTKKSWKRYDGPQQRAWEERLNHSRSLNLNLNLNLNLKLEPEPKSDTTHDMSVNMTDEEEVTSLQSDYEQVTPHQKENLEGECLSSNSELTTDDTSVGMDGCEGEEASSRYVSCSKRHPDRDPDGNPKPSKVRRQPSGTGLNPSYKYSIKSFCGVTDLMPDGFYDAGRDQPFMPLEDYEHTICRDSREVILLDRQQDEELDSIVIQAQLLLSSLKRPSRTAHEVEDELDNVVLRASVLALFVSDCFGGADRAGSLMRTRRAIVSLTKEQPFVCTCSGVGNEVINGNCSNLSAVGEAASRPTAGTPFGKPDFAEMCDKSLRYIKDRHNSNVVPLGTLQFGVCRHRALLMKYLCDRMNPPLPCELVRGYLDFMPHAWNAILVKRDNFLVRMVVDACYPSNIREETDPEYFCRYIPLSRLHVPLGKEASILGCSFPTPSMCREIEKTPAGPVYYCKIGDIDAAVKVRYLDTRAASSEEVREFEHKFLAEVRMLGALRNHRSIVEIYGHQLSCKWVPASDGSVKEYRLVQSVIVMEYVRGGSLKGYIEKLSKNGEKLVSIDLAFRMAREISCALVELHSKQIIHRDVKSENVLVDLNTQQTDRMPLVKLTDFDQSVPLQSQSHTCCIAHYGVHPPCVCVGTPRWMAPEVLRAMHRRHQYGLEVDVWSYGCFLLELLTLQVPYHGLSESEIYNHLQMREGPRLTKELEEFFSLDNCMTRIKLGITSDADAEKLKLMIELFYQCTKGEPSDRPTAEQIYSSLCSISCHS